MRVDVAELLKAPTGETRQLRVDDEELSTAAGGGHDRVSGTAILLRTQAGILVSARLTVKTQDACSRCLKPVDVTLELEFDEEYLPTVDVATGAALPAPEDPGALAIDDQQELDLTEAARQYRETALPMQPLCRPDCAGICPRCGRDLNLGACGCEPEAADPRWSALANLNKQMRDA